MYICCMKKIIILALLGFCLNSCEKTYDCVITTSAYGITNSSHTEFVGTNKEMKEFESSATNNNIITQTIDCK